MVCYVIFYMFCWLSGWHLSLFPWLCPSYSQHFLCLRFCLVQSISSCPAIGQSVFSVNSGHNPQQDFLPRKLVFRSLQPCLVALFLGSSYEQWTEFSTFDCFCSLTYLFLALWVPWDKKLTIHTFVFLASSLPQNGVLINICFVGVGIFCFYSCSFCWKSSFYIY